MSKQRPPVKVTAIALWSEKPTARRCPVTVRDVPREARQPLVASENALLAVEKILPKDRWQADEVRAEAIARAEQRLAEVRRHVEHEQL